jgi:plasmid stabilization system protein ParE
LTPPDARRIRFTPAAWRDAIEAYDWYLERSRSAADALLSELDVAIQRIAEGPEAFPPHRYGTRRYLLRRFKYDVVYEVMDEEIAIIAVAHQNRRPYWRARVHRR